MSELRRDPTTDRWVILAPGRARRPQGATHPQRAAQPARDPMCPFCPGNEQMTPPEISRTGTENGWNVRVIPNLFPAVDGGVPMVVSPHPFFGELPGVGAHEVIVESPQHDLRMDDMTHGDVVEVLRAWRERYRQLERRADVRAVVLFKNFGASAGTSLPHPHAQVIAVPVLTPDAMNRRAVAERYLADTGRSVYEDLVRNELEAGTRVVITDERLAAFCPFASRSPYEIWIAPTEHQPSFARLGGEDLDHLAEVLAGVLRALRFAAGDPDFNLVVGWTPAEGDDGRAFRWHIQILPRLSIPAGFELGSDMSINSVAPEDAAAALREALERPDEPSVN